MGQFVDLMVQQLYGQKSEQLLKEYRNRFHDVRMDDPLYQRDFLMAFHMRLIAHANFMEKLPFVREVNEWLGENGRDDPWTAGQVRNWTEAALFPKKSGIEQWLDSTLKNAAFTRLTGGTVPIGEAEAVVHAGRTAEQLKAEGFKRFYVVPKGAQYHSTARDDRTPMAKPEHKVEHVC